MDKKHFLKNIEWLTFEESADQKLNQFLNRIIGNDQYLFLSKDEFHHACSVFYQEAVNLKTRAHKEIFLKTLHQVLEAIFILKFDLNGFNEYKMWTFHSVDKQIISLESTEIPHDLIVFLTSKKNMRIDQKFDLFFKKKTENYFNPHLNFILKRQDEYELKFLFKDGFKDIINETKPELNRWKEFFKLLVVDSNKIIEVKIAQDNFWFLSRYKPETNPIQIEFLVINKS